MSTTRILFVEDDPEMSLVYQESFVEPEFDAVVAANRRAALEMLRKETRRFHVMVTEVSTPEMESVTLLRRIRKEFPDLLVVMITDYGCWSDLIDAHSPGIVPFLDKPIQMKGLKELIRTATI